jgi:hypothetical protein
MNSQTVKTVSVVLDENELWMLAQVMKDFYYDNPNRADRDDVRALHLKMRKEAWELLGLGK